MKKMGAEFLVESVVIEQGTKALNYKRADSD